MGSIKLELKSKHTKSMKGHTHHIKNLLAVFGYKIFAENKILYFNRLIHIYEPWRLQFLHRASQLKSPLTCPLVRKYFNLIQRRTINFCTPSPSDTCTWCNKIIIINIIYIVWRARSRDTSTIRSRRHICVQTIYSQRTRIIWRDFNDTILHNHLGTLGLKQ